MSSLSVTVVMLSAGLKNNIFHIMHFCFPFQYFHRSHPKI